MASVKKRYYKYFSLKIRNNEEFIKYALFKNDSYDIRFEDIYNAFSRKIKQELNVLCELVDIYFVTNVLPLKSWHY